QPTPPQIPSSHLLPPPPHHHHLWPIPLPMPPPPAPTSGHHHVATPMDFDSQDPETEVNAKLNAEQGDQVTVEGMLSIMRACKEADIVKRIVFTFSAGSVNIKERPRPAYDQDNWSHIDFCHRVKMKGWRERPGFISIIPTLVVGPFLSAGMPPSLVTALAFIMGNEAHYSILKQVQLVHLDNLCNAMTFLFEHPEANGPYISSSQDATIHVLARMLGDRFPEYDIPKKFAGVDDNFQPINFSKKPERRARGWGWRGGGWRRRWRARL
ncbi:hypothetical protein ZWY2020_040771, partial [Hordeum vulgare]